MNRAFLSRLVSHLLVNHIHSSSCDIMNGKMGGLLFFSVYARYSGISYYEDYCDLLMDAIFANLDKSLPITFGTGLTGIGWGVEYLIQHRYMEGDTDEILEPVDLEVMKTDPHLIKSEGFWDGLSGILLYVLARLKSQNRNKKFGPFTSDYLFHLQDAIKSCNNLSPEELSWHMEFEQALDGKMDYAKPQRIPDLMVDNLPEIKDDLSTYPLGIAKGITGCALKIILK